MDCKWVDWCSLPGAEQAAWVQAIGSLAAIVVAVAVPIWLAWRERKRISLMSAFRARSHAFLAIAALEQLEQNIWNAKSKWSRMPSSDMEVTEHLTVPTGITDRLLDMHELGEAGTAIYDAILALEQLRYDVEYNHSYLRNAGDQYDQHGSFEGPMPEPNDIDESFSRASAKARLARREVRAVFRGRAD